MFWLLPDQGYGGGSRLGLRFQRLKATRVSGGHNFFPAFERLRFSSKQKRIVTMELFRHAEPTKNLQGRFFNEDQSLWRLH